MKILSFGCRWYRRASDGDSSSTYPQKKLHCLDIDGIVAHFECICQSHPTSGRGFVNDPDARKGLQAVNDPDTRKGYHYISDQPEREM